MALPGLLPTTLFRTHLELYRTGTFEELPTELQRRGKAFWHDFFSNQELLYCTIGNFLQLISW